MNINERIRKIRLPVFLLDEYTSKLGSLFVQSNYFCKLILNMAQLIVPSLCCNTSLCILCILFPCSVRYLSSYIHCTVNLASPFYI